ncbi:hypothetical protein C2E23DRAFT_292444 [Lenzites betulinus]|nr:hypothetical protein C2E23DRAFT_292444 [Lenzites betulinus]
MTQVSIPISGSLLFVASMWWQERARSVLTWVGPTPTYSACRTLLTSVEQAAASTAERGDDRHRLVLSRAVVELRYIDALNAEGNRQNIQSRPRHVVAAVGCHSFGLGYLKWHRAWMQDNL